MTTVRGLAVACLVAGCVGKDTRRDPADARTPSSSRVATSAADSVRQFAQSFYDWYVLLGEKAATSRYDSLLIARAGTFAPPLLAALKEDVDAQRQTPDIVSVIGDYDPFLNSQDPCNRYDAREVVPVPGGYAVSVYSMCADGTATLAVIADVQRSINAWAFSNFRIPGQAQYDLVSQLRAAKAERDSPRPRTRTSR